MMTTASLWFVQHAAADPVPPRMQRSWDVFCAFHQWTAARQAAIAERNKVVEVKRQVNNVLLASIVDAWARLAIKSDRGVVEPSVRHPPPEEDEADATPRYAKKTLSEFLGEKLLPRGARVRVGAQAWASLSPKVVVGSLPGAERHEAAVRALLQARRTVVHTLLARTDAALPPHRRRASRTRGPSSGTTRRPASSQRTTSPTSSL